MKQMELVNAAADTMPSLKIPPAAGQTAGPAATEFRHALGHFATGVTVITALDENGSLQGLTANAVSSVSLDPPLILACITYTARSFSVLERRRAFSLHILAEGQAQVAKDFASNAERSSICAWKTTERGLPLLSEFHVALECSIEQIYPGGDHGIVVARVHQIHHGDKDVGPLLYYKGKMTPWSNVA
ncbi:MAG: flavin reductase [Rhodospirillaceae bacterium]|nr:MAG: flavin reductase [Rhodospirillaceae bacterium]